MRNQTPQKIGSQWRQNVARRRTQILKFHLLRGAARGNSNVSGTDLFGQKTVGAQKLNRQGFCNRRPGLRWIGDRQINIETRPYRRIPDFYVINWSAIGVRVEQFEGCIDPLLGSSLDKTDDVLDGVYLVMGILFPEGRTRYSVLR